MQNFQLLEKKKNRKRKGKLLPKNEETPNERQTQTHGSLIEIF